MSDEPPEEPPVPPVPAPKSRAKAKAKPKPKRRKRKAPTLARKEIDRGQLMDSGDLMSLPDPDYLIGETFQRGAVTMLHGRTTTGKTQAAMAILGGVAYGDSWGTDTFQRGLAIYVGCENFPATKIRYRAWCLLTKHDPSDVNNLQWYDGESTKFDIEKDLAGLETKIKDRMAARKEKPMVLIIDHIRRVLRGHTALSSKVAAATMAILEGIAIRLKIAVIVIAHTNKTNKAMSGSGIWSTYAQAEHAMEGEPGGKSVRLRGIKQRDASPGDIIFERRSVQVMPPKRKGGRPISSACLLFNRWEETTEGNSTLDDTAYLIALHMEPGEFTTFAEICRRCDQSHGGAQNIKIRKAVPMTEWKKIVVGDVTKAIRRTKLVPDGAKKEAEFLQCASFDDLSVYPLSEEPAGGTKRPKPRKPKGTGDTGPKRAKKKPPVKEEPEDDQPKD